MKKEQSSRFAKALGASRSHAVSQSVGGPLDMLALGREVTERFRSSGGRPSDPSWNISRQVPFNDLNWARLKQIAERVGVDSARVGPGQLAAMLVEHGLRQIETDEWSELLKLSRSQKAVASAVAAETIGVSYRQLETWCSDGLVDATHKTGRQHWFDHDAIISAMWLRLLRGEQDVTDVHGLDISSETLASRYLVATDGDGVVGVQTATQVTLLLATSGVAHLMDQLPLRKHLLGDDMYEEGMGFHERSTEAV